MAQLADIVFDCAHPASLARFWAAVLDGYSVAPYDDTEVARLAAMGVFDTEDDPTVLVEPTGVGPRLWFQKVSEPKTVKNRVHLDIRADDIDREVHRLEQLGAVVIARNSQPQELVVMQDPQGNEFCVTS